MNNTQEENEPKKKSKIQRLVDFALSDKLNQHKEIIIGKVSKKQAETFKQQLGIDLENVERCIDTSAIRHIIKHHGSEKTEKSRGQIAINLDDFDLITTVLEKADEVSYQGKNRLNQDVFLYKKKIENVHIVMEAVRISKKRGNKISISTMYKIKGSRSK
ncbi:PBECR3 domain-containing polyvalent protein [Capnocytophaga leadbetteri]|jgi:hypothetical protein|uniref:PBECR3 domain-containing polyvalent protein n=1 Tax=Capnocytophaga leadbetteri TaxID=327575 RepID=UPI0028EB2D8F|nr:hypothetical protein [Capnocytophaga leadbetteri]